MPPERTITAIMPMSSAPPMTPAITRSVRVRSRLFFAALALAGFAVLGLSLSMRFVIMSSVTVFFVML